MNAAASQKILRVFVSSPGDVRALEVPILDEVLDELNKDPEVAPYFRLESFKYEQHLPSVIGDSPQRSVDRYMMKASKADIFICIFWRRMGTPVTDQWTGKSYRSGTEYEFKQAFRASRRQRANGNRPVMLLYRCQRLPTAFRWRYQRRGN
jgi:hypothetical protein